MAINDEAMRPPVQTLRALNEEGQPVINDIKPKYGFNSFIGLMFHRQGRALIELPRPRSPAIHTYFMFFCLDLIFLRPIRQERADLRGNLEAEHGSYLARIVYRQRNATPWHSFVSPEPAAYALEVEAGLSEEVGLKQGDIIGLEAQSEEN